MENVGHLERMPVTGTTVVLGVVNLYDGSGGPMRILALVDLDCARASAGHLQASAAWLLASLALSALLAVFGK